MKSKELLLKHLNLNDCKGYVTSDGRLYKAIINALEEAINYTESREELEDRENRTILKVSEEDRVKLDSGHNVSFYNFNIYD